MTIHFVAIAKKDTKGFRIKASYSEGTLEARQHWEQVTISVLALADGNYRVEETLPSGKECFFAKKFDSKVHVVITTQDYPFWLAVECIDELSSGIDAMTSSTAITTTMTPSSMVAAATSSLWMSKEDKYRKRLQHCIHIFTKYSKNEPGCVLYDMRIMQDYDTNKENENHNHNHGNDNDNDEDQSSSSATMMMIPYSPEFWQQKKEYMNAVHRYLQSREEEAQHKKIQETQAKVDDVRDQMIMVMTTITLQNMVQSKRLQEHSEELLKQAMVFRKSAAALRKRTESHYHYSLGLAMVGTTVAVASAGGAVALAAGAEGLGLVAGAILGGVVGYQFSDSETAHWFYSLPRLIIRAWTTHKSTDDDTDDASS